MVWLLPQKAAKRCVGVACSLLAFLARVRTVLPSPRLQTVTRHLLPRLQRLHSHLLREGREVQGLLWRSGFSLAPNFWTMFLIRYFF